MAEEVERHRAGKRCTRKRGIISLKVDCVCDGDCVAIRAILAAVAVLRLSSLFETPTPPHPGGAEDR